MTNHNQGKKQRKYIELNGQMLRLKLCNRCNMSIYIDRSQKYEIVNNNMVKHTMSKCLEEQAKIRQVTNTSIVFHRTWHGR